MDCQVLTKDSSRWISIQHLTDSHSSALSAAGPYWEPSCQKRPEQENSLEEKYPKEAIKMDHNDQRCGHTSKHAWLSQEHSLSSLSLSLYLSLLSPTWFCFFVLQYFLCVDQCPCWHPTLQYAVFQQQWQMASCSHCQHHCFFLIDAISRSTSTTYLLIMEWNYEVHCK